jgi:flagellar biosynthesis GTPase FlhF
MTVRKFFAVKTHVAMDKVQNTMHPDAHILSVKRVKGGVEVLVDGELVDAETLQSDLAQISEPKQPENKIGTKQ